MSKLEVGKMAMINRPHKQHSDQLNGTLCTLIERNAFNETEKCAVWEVEFMAEPKINDYGFPSTWGWIQEEHLIPLNNASERDLVAVDTCAVAN